MERVGVLINKLQQLHKDKADAAQLLGVLQQLQAELTAQPRSVSTNKVVLLYPSIVTTISTTANFPRVLEEKLIEVYRLMKQPLQRNWKN